MKKVSSLLLIFFRNLFGPPMFVPHPVVQGVSRGSQIIFRPQSRILGGPYVTFNITGVFCNPLVPPEPWAPHVFAPAVVPLAFTYFNDGSIFRSTECPNLPLAGPTEQSIMNSQQSSRSQACYLY